MNCPTCGIEALDNTKFCTRCGTDIRAIKTSDSGAWPWQSWERFAMEQLRQKNKISPEEKRINEIRAGVICSSVGIGVFAFLFPFFTMLADKTGADILSMIPFAAAVPFFIGVGLIFNGWFLGKKLIEVKRREREELESHYKSVNTASLGIRPDAAQISQSNYSITDNTTYHLIDPAESEKVENK